MKNADGLSLLSVVWTEASAKLRTVDSGQL